MQLHQRAALLLCACIMGGVAAGCVRFQTGPSKAIAEAERVVLPGRGQVRVIERNPAGKDTVLLVHGFGASSASYKPVLDELAKDLRVLAVDLPGFGASDRRAGDYSPEALADVLLQILDARGVTGRVHVVGHSWGSSVALAFARRHPTRLDKLVIISGWIYEEQLLPLMKWSRVRGLGELLFGLFYREALGERMYLNFHDPRLVTEELVDEVRRQLGQEGAVAVALAAARGMRFGEHEREYRTINAETLLLWGREDRVARLGFGERLASEMPRVRLVVLPRCGHIPMWECRGETLHALQSFLVQPQETD